MDDETDTTYDGTDTPDTTTDVSLEEANPLYSDTTEEVMPWQNVEGSGDPATMDGWTFEGGVWTDPSGKEYDMSYLTSNPTFLKSIQNFFKKSDGTYDFGKMAAFGSGLASLTGLNQAQQRPVGYQGKIPTYKAVQQRVAIPSDPNRRPGAGGRRYFTDMQYAKPEGIAAAQEAAATQAESLKPALMQAPAAKTVPAAGIATTTPVQQSNAQGQFLESMGLNYPSMSQAYLNAQKPVEKMATGGIATLASGKYLRGHTDGMADKIPAQIGEDQPAKLSHGEFVIPADVVSHLGNGNSDAGANVLYAMMAKVRKARTGNEKQGKRIKPEKFMPGGGIKAFAPGGEVGVTGVGNAVNAGVTGTESNLSSWAGDYVTDMLGKGKALSETPYQAYEGPLTADASALQKQAFDTASKLNVPTEDMGGFKAGTFDITQANKYMNPFLQAALNPVLEEQRRQAQINRLADSDRLAAQGAYGGGRQAIMESEQLRNLGQLQNKTLTEGYKTAYDKAMDQFNKEQGLGLQAQDLTNKYGLSALEEQLKQGAVQRGIESEGIAADKAQFEEERNDPFKKVTFQQSLLQGLPTAAQSYTPAQTSLLQQLAGAGALTTEVYEQLKKLGVIKP